MRGAKDPEAAKIILDVVEELLMTRGYDGFQLLEVAQRAHVSLSRIYKLFGTREELVVAAVERWMAANAYAGLAPPYPDLPVYDGLLSLLRAIFEPWEQNPRMLEAFHRARRGAGGDQLLRQANAVLDPAFDWVLRTTDPGYAADAQLLLRNVFYAVFGKFADGEMEITEVMPTLERVAFRLTTNNAAAVATRRVRRPVGRDKPSGD